MIFRDINSNHFNKIGSHSRTESCKKIENIIAFVFYIHLPSAEMAVSSGRFSSNL